MAVLKADNGAGGGGIQGWHVLAGMIAFFGVISGGDLEALQK